MRQSSNAAAAGARVINFHRCNKGNDLSIVDALLVTVDACTPLFLPPHIVDCILDVDRHDVSLFVD
jgi:hypothetical protein